MVNYAQRFEYGLGVTEDMGKAVALYQKAAEKGNTFANLRLGMFYGLGNELPDRGKSCKHYMVGAKEYSYAQQALAACYEEGVPGFPKDIKKAVSYYEQAASAQIPYLLSHYKLGYLYFFGIGIEKNARLAAKFLIKGATAPQTFVPLPSAGYYILGLMYEDGDGVTKSDEDAFTNYMKGAEAGHPASQNKVGAKYAEGKGVTKDVNRALMWFTIAAANGFKDAAENRDKAEKLLKPAEIKRTQKLAKDWLEKHPTI
jgi:TPR repeat protein